MGALEKISVDKSRSVGLSHSDVVFQRRCKNGPMVMRVRTNLGKARTSKWRFFNVCGETSTIPPLFRALAGRGFMGNRADVILGTVCAALVAVGLLFCACSDDEPSSGQEGIVGKVVVPNGVDPVPFALVTLYDDQRQYLSEVTADARGEFAFSIQPFEGERLYYLFAEKGPYRTPRMVSVVVRDGRSDYVTITMDN